MLELRLVSQVSGSAAWSRKRATFGLHHDMRLTLRGEQTSRQRVALVVVKDQWPLTTKLLSVTLLRPNIRWCLLVVELSSAAAVVTDGHDGQQ